MAVRKDDALKSAVLRLEEKMKNLFVYIKDDQNLDANLNDYYAGYETTAEQNFRMLTEKVPIVVTGETGSGKSSFLNLFIEQDVFPTSTIPCTAAIIRIQRADACYLVLDDKEKVPIIAENAENAASELQKLLIEYAAPDRTKEVEPEKVTCTSVDIFWPYPCKFLKENVVLVDSPGVGESEEMTQILMQYLPRALAIIFVVNAANSGGVAKDRLLKILYDFSSYCDKHKIEHPDESRAIFLVNKWDSISRKEKDKVLTYIQQNLKETWPGFQQHQLKTCSFMKMEESIAVEIAERTTEDRTELEKFRELQQMIGDVVSLSLIARYTDAFLVNLSFQGLYSNITTKAGDIQLAVALLKKIAA